MQSASVWFDLFNVEAVSEQVLAGTEIPGGKNSSVQRGSVWFNLLNAEAESKWYSERGPKSQELCCEEGDCSRIVSMEINQS